ncbi:hypothetical protein ACWDBW_33435 [Streptomyces sp. NPDC001107]
MKNKAGSALVALALATGLGVAATGTATASTVTPKDNPVVYRWKVTHVGAGYRTYGGWKTCDVFSKSGTTRTVGCSLSTSVTTTVSGTLSVSVKAVSAAVGYSAAKTYSVTASESYSAAKNKSGRVQWRSAYTTNKVTQSRYACLAHGTDTCTATGEKHTAYAHKFIAPNFRLVYDR